MIIYTFYTIHWLPCRVKCVFAKRAAILKTLSQFCASMHYTLYKWYSNYFLQWERGKWMWKNTWMNDQIMELAHIDSRSQFILLRNIECYACIVLWHKSRDYISWFWSSCLMQTFVMHSTHPMMIFVIMYYVPCLFAGINRWIGLQNRPLKSMPPAVRFHRLPGNFC